MALEPVAWKVVEGRNLANEPRDDLIVDGIVPADAVVGPAEIDASELRRRGALARACMMAGALERVLEASSWWLRQREQFGSPIGRFQAVQQQVAQLAGEVAATVASTDAAANAEQLAPAPHAVAAAKVRASEAAGVAAGIAHQLHGAIGLTQEHDLHHLTRRLWSWRDEYGSEVHWGRLLGERLMGAGEAGVWPLLTTLGTAR
ncbi:MAG: acyl-CoA dehydrogenase family protein [Thermoleophilaceae bacterium]